MSNSHRHHILKIIQRPAEFFLMPIQTGEHRLVISTTMGGMISSAEICSIKMIMEVLLILQHLQAFLEILMPAHLQI